MVKNYKKFGYKSYKKGKNFSRKGSNSDKKSFRKKDSKECMSSKLDQSKVKFYNYYGMGHFATKCKKQRLKKANPSS